MINYKFALIPTLLLSAGLMAQSGFKDEEFTINSGGEKITVLVRTPAKLAAKPMLLLSFSAGRKDSVPGGKYGDVTEAFIKQGHRIASIDLPAHGDRVDKKYGSGIKGFANYVADGKDPFDIFVLNAKDMITECLKRGLATKGNIVSCGVSRAGYCALRLTAEDSRISGVAAFAPVTDWGVVSEFESIRKSPNVAKISLERFAAKLVDRKVYVAIGNRDDRVGTDACTRFVLALTEALRKKGEPAAGLRYMLVEDSKGHGLGKSWRVEGIRYLLGQAPQTSPSEMP